MKSFKPKKLEESVNYCQRHPALAFGEYLLKGLIALALIYLFVGLTLEFLIMRMPIKHEVWLWDKLGISEQFETQEDPTEYEETIQNYLEDLLSQIPESLRGQEYQYDIIFIDDIDANALALPGGKIVLTSGLYEMLESENALTFVIGHELGHIKNRDHLRGMGFNFASILTSLILAGQDGGISRSAAGLYELAWLGHSRHLEKEADIVGLEAIMHIYGHAGGADEVFEKLEEGEGKFEKMVPTIMSTHPGNEERIAAMRQHIEIQSLPVENTKEKAF